MEDVAGKGDGNVRKQDFYSLFVFSNDLIPQTKHRFRVPWYIISVQLILGRAVKG